MKLKSSSPWIAVPALALLVAGSLSILSCNAAGSLSTVASASSGSGSELEGPIEQLSPASGTPTALRIFGVTINIQGAQIVLKSSSGSSNIVLSPLDLAPTQFAEVKFVANIASQVEVEEAEAKGTLVIVQTFNPGANVTVNRNPRTIETTLTVAEAGVLCDNAFTRVEVSAQVGSCELLGQLNGVEVEVEGLVVDDFALSLSNLTTSVAARDVILASRVKRSSD